MTHCTPHYPARRWLHCRLLLPVSVGVRVHYRDPLHWVPLIVKPYRTYPYLKHGFSVVFPRCYRRGLPFHKGWRW